MTDELLDRVKLLTLWPREFARVFQPIYGDVLSVHPDPPGRFALKNDMPRGVIGAGGWYLGDTVDAALWESVLRDVEPDDDGGVYLDRSVLAPYALQWVRIRAKGEILRMEHPARRHVVNASNVRLNAKWDQLVAEDIYPLTHVAAGLVQLQFHFGLMELPGISWRSRQSDAGIVHLFYDPPSNRSDWEMLGIPVPLASDDGIRLIRDALTAANMVLLTDPVLTGGTPDPAAL
ncbi:hypothetical protein [Pinirhizobacter sp.]|jgi:hypothetical protein|uniref:hypothetical protein n=1 Tax=Pinirhizobacter sp. TaxID=2950432 RepID=UPI002F406874